MLKINPIEETLSDEEKLEKQGKLTKEYLQEKLLTSKLSDFEVNSLKKIFAEEKNEDKENIELLDIHKEIKINHLNQICNENILNGFISNALGSEHLYDFKENDQMNFTMQLAFLNNISNEDMIYWKTEDSGVLPHSKEQFLQVCSDAELHKRNNIGKYWELKMQVENALTHEEINLIQWNYDL